MCAFTQITPKVYGVYCGMSVWTSIIICGKDKDEDGKINLMSS